MDPKSYQAAAARTECDQLKTRVRMYGVWPHVPDGYDLTAPVRLNHAVIGMMGEVGEIAQLLEKWIYYNQKLDTVKIAEETGDLLWYVAELCNALNLDLGAVMEANIAKLRARFPEKYEDEKAARENRDAAAETEAMKTAVQKGFSSVHSSPLPLDDAKLGERFLRADNARPADHPNPFGYEEDKDR